MNHLYLHRQMFWDGGRGRVTDFPFRIVGLLRNRLGGRCTGTVVGGNKVLTNAHCVYDVVGRRFTRLGEFIPARSLQNAQGSYVEPFGKFEMLHIEIPVGFWATTIFGIPVACLPLDFAIVTLKPGPDKSSVLAHISAYTVLPVVMVP